MFGPDLVSSARAVLLHIGPHKTGTTAVQSALRQARLAMARHGVEYAGRGRIHMRLAALAVTGRPGLQGDRDTSDEHWVEVRDQVHEAAHRRVIVSSEFFADANNSGIRRIARDIGPDRLNVVVTLRHLDKILPSSWQQYVRNQMTTPYDDWLEATLNGEPFTSPTVSFWRRHRHDELIMRWTDVVGPHNVAVVVLDEANRELPLRAFERMAELPEGLLGAGTEYANRSLTAAEVELVRQLNVEAVVNQWPTTAYHLGVRQGAVRFMQRSDPAASEARIATPHWACERAAEIGADAAAKIAALGVAVYGDLDSLGVVAPREAGTDQTSADVLPVDRVREAILGTISSGGLLTPEADGRRRLDNVTARDLLAVLARRGMRRIQIRTPVGTPSLDPRRRPDRGDEDDGDEGDDD